MNKDFAFEGAKALLALAGASVEELARAEGLITGKIDSRLLLTTAAAQELTEIPPGTWSRIITEDRQLAACRRIVGDGAVRWYLPALQRWAARLPKAKKEAASA